MRPAQAAPADIAKAIARDLDLQTAMPTVPPPGVPEPPLWLFNFELSHNVVSIILWGAIILGAATIIWAMRDNLPLISRSRRLKGGDAAAPDSPSVVARMEEAQIEADELARRGLIADAMHVLLLQSLTELRQRLNLSFSASMTSREILQNLDLPDGGRTGLSDLIARVERAYFGDHAVAIADYAACRASYERLTAALGATAARRASIPPTAAAA